MIPDLFDHARRGRVDTVFFGAVEVDGEGRTNLSAAGLLAKPRVKFPGVAGGVLAAALVQAPRARGAASERALPGAAAPT